MKVLLMTFVMIWSMILTNAQSNKIEIGIMDTIDSKILNEKRPIWIYKPNNLSANSKSQERYPVIYLLDGDWHFVSVVGTLQQLSFINGNTICPEMMIVGIPIADRYRDLTPYRDSTIYKNSGGYENFITFIKNELFPYIESKYPISPYKTLIGHSLGGLTTINTIIKHPDYFNSYIAIDPSMWWFNQKSLIETKEALSKNDFTNKKLFLAIANTMDRDMDSINVRNDKTRNTLPIRSLFELSDYLKSPNSNKLDYKVKYYNNENHGSIPHIATYDALHFIFNYYKLNITKKDYVDDTMSLSNKIKDHYKNISEKMGYTIIPSENYINTLGYNAIYMKNLSLAESLFKQNINNYPNSFNAYDSMGDYYLLIENYNLASSMYQKALSIYENIDTKKKLDAIKSNLIKQKKNDSI